MALPALVGAPFLADELPLAAFQPSNGDSAMATTPETLELTVHIKSKAEPIQIGVPPSITPRQIVEDLQEQGHVPDLADRTVQVTHGSTNLQMDVHLDKQGVRNGETIAILWDGKLAGGSR